MEPPPSVNAYPNVNPYPAGPVDGSAPGPSGSPMPAAGPGAGFPMRSGLAGMQPHSMSSPPNMVPGSGAGLRGGLPEEKNVFEMVRDNTNVYARKFQGLLDRSTPHMMERWAFTGFLFFCFSLVVVLRQGWYIVMYALAIYILNLFLAFLQPRFDPSLADDLAQEDVEEGAPGLPGSEPKSPGGIRGLLSGFSNGGDDEEFRPFIRRLPEFKFWYSATKATTIALLCTITRATDVPVYWPILLVYFCTLFALTMRRQIQHMIKYRYIPWDLGRKQRYGGRK
ncbi:ER to transport-related protein [Trichosporon asahii var. asahii CBS 8904]|uniref:ER to transport-related protein n=1 Tax=Trichosporon asahii var. asahii (strain CBS 8904) TaxID=1220162 RepID=K1VLP3_TRIAC|nr:ER to transport-related protein [Trichosporon asahii var. asahii CBS 8904]